MHEPAGTKTAFQKLSVAYYAICWLPLTLFATFAFGPTELDERWHPYEKLIKAILAVFPSAGLCLAAWGLRTRSRIVWVLVAMVPGCLILLWYVTGTNYMHFLKGPDHVMPNDP